MSRRWSLVAILLATLALACVAVRWADREFQHIEPPSRGANQAGVSRPDWVRALGRPYRRFRNGWAWACVAATVGVAAVVASDARTWRAPLGSGSIVSLVTLLIVVATLAHFLLAAPPFFRAEGVCYGLRDALQYRVPGAILGAWCVTWGRKSDWRGRLVVGMWMVNMGLLVAYPALFG
jgi:hypothetical protein